MACKNNGPFCTCPDGARFKWCFKCKDENPQPTTSQDVPSPVLSQPQGFMLTSTIAKPAGLTSSGIVPVPPYKPARLRVPSTPAPSGLGTTPVPTPSSSAGSGCQAASPKKFCVGPTGFGSRCGPCDAIYKRAQVAVLIVAKPPRIVPEPTVVAQIKLFRGDERPPEQIKFGGLDLWGEAQGVVERTAGAGFRGKMANYICSKCAEKKNGATFADWVRNSKDRSRPTVSTAENSGCGGYASGNIYLIAYDGLTRYPFGKAIMPAAYQNIVWDDTGNTGKLEVWMDTPKLETSNLVFIDIKLDTGEWAAFHKIGPEKILWYRDAKNDGDFVTMATIVGAAPGLK